MDSLAIPQLFVFERIKMTKELISKKRKERYLLKKKAELKTNYIYRQNHKKEIKIQKQKYYNENKSSILLKNKQWRDKNKEKINKHAKIYRKNRRNRDINFKLRCYMITRLYSALKGFNKSAHTEELIGCTIEHLKQHLESKFTNGMSWKNYGKWHVDHIKSCASFNLSKKSEQYKCFNYKNLQPLWAVDNLRKRQNRSIGKSN